MRKYYLLGLFFSAIVISQKKPNPDVHKNKKDSLKTFQIYCDNLIYKENFKLLIPTAKRGIVLAGENKLYLSKFYYYQGYGYEYFNNQYLVAIACYEKSLIFAQQIKNIEAETIALMRLNYLYYSSGKFKKRDDLIIYIKKIVDTTKNNYAKAVLNGSLGEYYLNKSEYQKFINYKLKAITYRKTFLKSDITNQENIGISYDQIAEAYIKMKSFDKAIEYTNYAFKYLKSPTDVVYLYNNYISCYVAKKNTDSVHKYFKKVYSLVSKKDSLYLNLSMANQELAELYLSQNKINGAKILAERSLVFANKSNDDITILDAKIALGKVFFYKKEYKKSIENLKSISQVTLSSEKESFVIINKLLSQNYAEIKDWQKAYAYNKIYSANNDSLLTQSAEQSIANAEATYQNKNKKQQILNLSAQNLLKNLQIKNAQIQKWYLLAGLGFLIIIGGLLYYQNRKRKQINSKLEILNKNLDIKNIELDQANQTKIRFFNILNHDLRGPVSNLIDFLQIQKDSPDLLDEATKNRIQDTTLSSAENLLVSMEDILLWSKGQMENFKPQPKQVAVNQLFEDTKKVFSGYIKIKFEYQNPENLEVFTDENYLKTIIRNLTSNAINVFTATENLTIIWKAWQESGKLYLSITDNGPGASHENFKALYDETQVVGIKSGLGLHLIRDLAKAINCDITVDSKVNQGTTFVLNLR